jgi:hypothetical protein
MIFFLIAILYFVNKRTKTPKHYFHILLIPAVCLLTARKTIAQNDQRFYLNESFASWLIMMVFGGIASTMQWYTVVAVNFFCFVIYLGIIFRHYGSSGVGNDLYVHMITSFIFSSCLIRINEVNMRSSFNLLRKAELQEEKWQRVLRMLTDGVLLMQHTESDLGILLVNPSL